MSLPERRPLHILVVEDDRAIRETLVLILEDEGHKATGASNGREALDRLRDAGVPDLLLLDLKMPGMDGLELGQAVRREPGCAQLPIVLMSAATRVDPTRVAFGPAAFLRKPLDLEGLLALIDRLVAHGQGGRPIV